MLIPTPADGEVVDFNKPKGPSPATNAPAQPRSPAIAATPTPPPPRAPSAAPDDAPSKTAEEKKADFAKKIQETLRQESAKDTSDAAADEAKVSQAAKDKEAEVAAKAKADAEEKAKTDAEAKAKADAEKAKTDAEAKATNDAKKAEVDAEEKKRLEDEEMERMIAEMEEEERKREEDEKRYAEEKKLKDAEKKAKAAESVREEEERLRKLEREAEEAEEAKESESPEQKAEREAKDKALFAGLKKNTQFGPQSTEQETASEETSTPEPAATVKSAPVATSKPKPTALKLDTNKSIEPSAPTAGMQSLKSARFLQVKSELVAYPEGIASPNPALNARNKGRTYDKDFLLQFQEVFKEKPSVDWDLKLKETVGDGSESARTPGPRAGGMMSGSGRQPSGRGGAPGGGMGNFQGASAPRTLPMGTTSAQRFEQSQRGGSSMTNPLAHMVPQRNGGGFAMGARNSSYQAAQPNSPRNASHSQRGPPRGGAGGGSRRGGGGGGRDSDAKTMPLTAGQNLKPIETTETGWKPTSITSTAPPVSGHMAPDMVQRKVKAALNKMTPEKFDKISDQILEIAAQSKDETDGRTLRQVIQLTFEKACDESHWSSMYAKFCSRMLATMSTDIKDENVKDKHGNAVVGG
jgi:translation initiation factor 4G